MSLKRIPTLGIIICLMLVCTSIARGQGGGGTRRTTPKKQTSPPSASTQAQADQDRWWAAQRSIEAAIQQLEAYLKESPNGDRAATAHQQLEVLRSLSITASRTEWVKMNNFLFSYAPDWRIAAVDPQAKRTRVTIEINCRREDGTDCYFDPFDRHPLVLIDNAGRFYPQLEAGALPPDIKLKDDGKAVLSGGRVITLIVDFAPLSIGAVSGQVYYRDKNEAQPARFSLSRRK
jgi:hypothetical protein